MWSPSIGEEVQLEVLGFTYKARVLGIADYLLQNSQYYIEYIDMQANPLTCWVLKEQLSPIN